MTRAQAKKTYPTRWEHFAEYVAEHSICDADEDHWDDVEAWWCIWLAAIDSVVDEYGHLR
jgi:hypothetical protein